jgi:hypothetical protein
VAPAHREFSTEDMQAVIRDSLDRKLERGIYLGSKVAPPWTPKYCGDCQSQSSVDLGGIGGLMLLGRRR